MENQEVIAHWWWRTLLRSEVLFPVKLLLALLVLGGILASSLFSGRAHYTPDEIDRLVSACRLPPDIYWQNCVTDVMERVVRQDGFKAAFRNMELLYTAKPDWALGCHRFTHILGEAVYRAGEDDWGKIVAPETAFCDFGFYHAYVAALIADTGDAAKGQAFCAYAESRLAGQQNGIRVHCDHAMGHGLAHLAVQHAHDAAGDDLVRIVTTQALRRCEDILSERLRRGSCASGVFDMVQKFSMLETHGFAMNRTDPLWLCREQPDRYAAECYRESKGPLLLITKENLREAAMFVENVADDRHAATAIHHLALRTAQRKIFDRDREKTIADCRALQERLRLPCISGFGVGLLLYGPIAENPLHRALEFCGLGLLTNDERVECFREVFAAATGLLPKERMQRACTMLDTSYQAACRSL